MNLFNKVSEKDTLKGRNALFKKFAIPALQNNGFVHSPFSTSWFGKNNLGDFSYEFCRISQNFDLEFVIVHVSRGDLWVKIYLNIFHLEPEPSSLSVLKGLDGLQFHLPPNNATLMRLGSDDIENAPLFSLKFMLNKHKLGFFLSEKGFEAECEKLGEIINRDLQNINSSIKIWHRVHQLLLTDWEGNPLTSV